MFYNFKHFSQIKRWLSGLEFTKSVLDLGLDFTASLGPRASTKVESHASFTEYQNVSQLTIFYLILNTKKLGKTII